ncbi:MAG: hypothetical protein QOK49_3416 [Baekduia sp.]|jgi:hypothetical protein|nr:hypothetical protein [Baekduia sp.]
MTETGGSMDDSAIQALVTRLARRGRGGTLVIERAAILAEGSECEAVESWILARGGRAEMAAVSTGGGLWGDRGSGRIGGSAAPAARYVLPADALQH